MTDKNEIEAIQEVMEHCKTCDSQPQCLQPCGLAKAILLIHGLEYKGR